MVKKILTFSKILLIGFIQLNAQKGIELIHADSVIGSKIAEQNIRDYIGNVFLRQGDIEIKCEKATHFIDNNSASFSGKVYIRRANLLLQSEFIEYDGNKSEANSPSDFSILDTNAKLYAKKGHYNFRTNVAHFRDSVLFSDLEVKINSDELFYDRKSDIIISIGNSKLETDSLIHFADTLEYNRKLQILKSKKNAKVLTKFEGYQVIAGQIFLNREKKYSWATEFPMILYIDSSITQMELNFPERKLIRYDSLLIFADSIFATLQSNVHQFYFYRNVKLFKQDVTVSSAYGYFEKETGWGYFIEKPFIWVDSTEFRCDSLCFFVKENKITRLKLIGKGSIFSPSKIYPKNVNVILSDTFWVYFLDGKIDYVYGRGNSKTSYFIESKDEGVNLANYMSDSLKIYFENSQAHSVTWFGNVYGEVIPNKIYAQNLNKYYNLPKDYLINKPQSSSK
ncbi:MAG: LptA/OstA family protein [Candidatus Kapaibacteriales bacterium]